MSTPLATRCSLSVAREFLNSRHSGVLLYSGSSDATRVLGLKYTEEMSSTKGITDEMVHLVGKGVAVRSGELVVVKFSSISGRVGNGLSFR